MACHQKPKPNGSQDKIAEKKRIEHCRIFGFSPSNVSIFRPQDCIPNVRPDILQNPTKNKKIIKIAKKKKLKIIFKSIKLK